MLSYYRVTIKGLRPLLTHDSSRLANPMSELSKSMKAITKKRTKTDEDHIELARLEWIGSLYVDEAGKPIIPGVNIEGMLHEAAKKIKLGKDVKAAVLVPDASHIVHDGPKNATWKDLIDQDRFRDVRGVKVNNSRVMRTRPRFDVWSLAFTVQADTELIQDDQLKQIVQIGGRQIGLGDYRPHFGLYEMTAFSKEG